MFPADFTIAGNGPAAICMMGSLRAENEMFRIYSGIHLLIMQNTFAYFVTLLGFHCFQLSVLNVGAGNPDPLKIVASSVLLHVYLTAIGFFTVSL